MHLISTEAGMADSENVLVEVMLSEIMKPRLRVQVIKGTSAVPTQREVG